MSRFYSKLLREPGAVRSSIEGSTAEIDHPGLGAASERAFRALAADLARGTAGKSNMAGYSSYVDQRIGEMLRPYPLDYPGLAEILRRKIETAGPEKHGFRRVPGIETIRQSIAVRRSTLDAPPST